MANVSTQSSNTGSGSTSAQVTVARGNTAVSSKNAQHVVPADREPKQVFETPSGEVRCDN